MSPIPVNLATEDELSELTLYRLLEVIGGYAVGTPYRRGGFGYLRRTIRGWNSAAKGIPFIVLTDLDSYRCPMELIDDWLKVPKHENLIFRVAVREVESWLLADAANLAHFLGVRRSLIPDTPDLLHDPKRTLVELARKSHLGRIRTGIAPPRGSSAKQGPDYNGCLGEFVRKSWNVNDAMKYSPSLEKAVVRLSRFAPDW
jgi:hypothetical protein